MDTNFKLKKKKVVSTPKVVSKTITMDSIHKNIVDEIINDSKNTHKLQDEENRIRRELANIQPENIHQITILNERLRQNQIKRDPQQRLLDYYVNNTQLLMSYYDNTPHPQSDEESIEETSLSQLLKFDITSSNDKRREIQSEYLLRMKLNIPQETIENSKDYCCKCKVEYEENHEEGVLLCPSCGSEKYLIVTSDNTSFNDNRREKISYSYKKVNHLNEILNQFQHKDHSVVPPEVIDEIMYEIKKQRITDLTSITIRDMREILKKINQSKYYDHTIHILSRINGIPPPIISPADEEKIRTLFQEIQAPFMLYSDNEDRTNFLSYAFILLKIFELLEMDSFKKYFWLLKSRDRLIKHDMVWKKICAYLKWEFIPSI